ncbi:MAG: hypothetical protein QOE51_3349 [Actinoplanes sp.]|jgi:hypothetical protein|nr:hypothetical protein [Actinoplanes sp.]
MTALPRFGTITLAVAMAAGGVLVFRAPHHDRPPPAGRVPAALAWPSAQRADMSGNLGDGPLFAPGYFLDVRTAVGTAPSPDGASVRLLVRTGSSVREIRRLPAARTPYFANFAAAGDDLVWTESTDAAPIQVWAVNLRDGSPARRLTTDTGNAVFYDSQYDLVIADGRVHWTAATLKGAETTEIRSVPLAGGAVEVRREPGSWALTSWPWLTNGLDQPSTSRLRNMATNRDVTVDNAGTELSTCSSTWCRVMVMNSNGLARIDLMHPDGTARRQIAGSAALAAITDVAVLDRFAVLDEAGPASDLTGTAQLLVYDIANKRTVDISADVTAAFSRGGVLWWSTGNQDAPIWHSLDLRTV